MATCESCSSTKEKLFGVIFVCPRCDRRISKKSKSLNKFALDYRINSRQLADALGYPHESVVDALKGKLAEDDPFWKEMEYTYKGDWLAYLKEGE